RRWAFQCSWWFLLFVAAGSESLSARPATMGWCERWEGWAGWDQRPLGGPPLKPPPSVEPRPVLLAPPDVPEEEAVAETVPTDMTTCSPADRPDTTSVLPSPFRPSVTVRV